MEARAPARRVMRAAGWLAGDRYQTTTLRGPAIGPVPATQSPVSQQREQRNAAQREGKGQRRTHRA